MIKGNTHLERFAPTVDYLVCIDSDGCVFDTMGIKQRECFCPWMIAYYDLQPVAEAARECKTFADLFSKTRGANRHITIKRILTELLPSHPLVRERGFQVPHFSHYFAWVEDPKSVLSDSGLRQAIELTESDEVRDELARVLAWSERVNWAVEEIVRGVPPFPKVLDSLARLHGRADIIVVSATPCEALRREWQEHGIAQFTALICGQENGSKTEHISLTRCLYDKGKVLVIGDAPGDLEAAKANDTLFFPIIPGEEIASWEKFNDEGLSRFFEGRYAGKYEQTLIERFDRALPEHPPWEARR